MTAPRRFLKEARSEFDKVIWPNREQAIRLTIIVIIVSAICGLMISGLDYLFSNLVEMLIRLK